jgi:hypothetical protein
MKGLRIIFYFYILFPCILYIHSLIYIWCFETRSHDVAQAGPELTILLPPHLLSAGFVQPHLANLRNIFASNNDTIGTAPIFLKLETYRFPKFYSLRRITET